ncbi:TetR/AcrR family transcriptional regulator [Streptomyces sp. NPDC056663]|uniref:TetR/AcrR family transcriptional regulator n=1 Tax=Streptomyces sp. NPDC056663 TaxID=3345899 RepID=UPI00369B086A
MSAENKRTRDRIMDIAAELLAASTSGQISTREVCEASGITPPTLYHHFGDKDGLLQAVVTEGFERYLTCKRALGMTGDLVRDFRRGWDMHVEFGVSNPALYHVMYGRPGKGRTTPAAEAAHAHLVAMMHELDDAGRLQLPAEVAADVLEAAAVGTTLHLIRTRSTVDDPMAVIVRDAVAATVIGPARTYTASPATAQLEQAAARLRVELPHGPVATLRASETALMHEWLSELTNTTDDRAPGSAAAE